MGRITIFSIEACNFCRRTKTALSARGIPYTDINIESYPSKRADMISLTDKLTVPQVFWNDDHVGGAEETLAVLAKWDEEIASDDGGDESGDKTPHDRYVRLIESKADPTDERLAVPTGPPEVKQIDFSAPRSKETFEINGTTYQMDEFMKLLVQNLPCKTLSSWRSSYYNVCKGVEGIAVIQDIFHLESTEQAKQLALLLQRKNIIHPVAKGEYEFRNKGCHFRLQPFESPSILNSFCVWSDPVNDDPLHLIHRLGKLWSKLESSHVNDEGLVDHATLRDDDLYWKFEVEVCEIQRICLERMGDEQKMAFIINLYNLMIKYAFCKVGIPAETSTRGTFFDDVSFNVGGYILSFNDLEHGVLRANTRHPYQMTKRFSAIGSRKMLALKKVDPRIHFALNCGAKSCPPVKRFTAEAVDEELRLAAMAFCEDDTNVAIDEKKGKLRLSKILQWYQSDFVRSKSELPEKVMQYLRGEKKEKLSKLIEQGNLSVEFLAYDWSSNDTNSITFEKKNLSSHSTFPFPSSPPSRPYESVQKEITTGGIPTE